MRGTLTKIVLFFLAVTNVLVVDGAQEIASTYVIVYTKSALWTNAPVHTTATSSTTTCASFARGVSRNLTFLMTAAGCSVRAPEVFTMDDIRLKPGYDGFTRKLYVPHHRLFGSMI